MMGAEVQLHYPPRRIVSVVPSQTELLFDLGLDTEVVGITKFCVHPEAWFRSKMRVGGTKQLHLEKIKALEPDLIIANKEENTKDQIEALGADFPVWTSDIGTLDHALAMIRQVAAITGKEEKGLHIAQTITERFSALQAKANPVRTLYLIWRNPWMSVGHDTFINDMMARAGFINVCSDLSRYPQLSAADIIDRKPELVLLSSEPYPFRKPHIIELQAIVPDASIHLADGEMFSWYGSRLLQTAAYLNSLAEKI